MKFEIGNNVISAYKRLSYEAWYALAEFVDNSTQAYLDNKGDLDALFNEKGETLKVSITYDPSLNTIVIEDNSIGMNSSDLEKAMKLGIPPDNPSGRSRYGLGMKTAACWFGNNWSITTKKLGAISGFILEIDVDKIAKTKGDVVLKPKEFKAKKNEHYTIITIKNLNRKLVGRTLGKIQDFLSEMYRYDFYSYGLKLIWNGSTLKWKGYEDELYVMTDGVKAKKEFSFKINGKQINGWVGVLGKGFASRKKAGFSLTQNHRVIQNDFKPSSLFGEQDEGSNDLVNQRLTGELQMDNFAVSHTKDKIVWEGEEKEDLDKKLGEICADMKELALTLRFRKETQAIDNITKFKEEVVPVLESELKSNEILNFLKTTQPYPEKIIEASYEKTYESVEDENEPVIEVKIGSGTDAITVLLYFNERSEFEPYVLTEATIKSNKVIVIINMLHPFIQGMISADSLLNFIRHAVYDGVAEWKALKLRGNIQPFTIKFLKDGLLRIPFDIKLNKFV